ncbi:MAG: type VI secretion system protein TssL, long form [Rhodocyclaceae bacterium]
MEAVLNTTDGSTESTGKRASEHHMRNPPEDAASAEVESLLSKRNPLLAAAGPLLRALADMPAALPTGIGMEETKSALRDEVRRFQQTCERANLRRDHVLGARYALCTALDEAAAATPWGGTAWINDSLLVHFHQDNDGGATVFRLLGLLLNAPIEHLNVIEIIYHLLGLGFRGRYARITDGSRQIESLRQQLFDLLSSSREKVPRDLSPHWQPYPARRFGMMRIVPLWLTIATLGLCAVGVYAWYEYHLLRSATALNSRIITIGNITPAPRILRLRQILKEEIAENRVEVDEDDLRSQVVFKGDDMFEGGASNLNEKMYPILDKVAAAIERVSGSVTVVGHTDNTPVRPNARISSNQELSEERAVAVMEYLISKGIARNRLIADGKGDTQPLAGNRTKADKAKNRRVELLVDY